MGVRKSLRLIFMIKKKHNEALGCSSGNPEFIPGLRRRFPPSLTDDGTSHTGLVIYSNFAASYEDLLSICTTAFTLGHAANCVTWEDTDSGNLEVSPSVLPRGRPQEHLQYFAALFSLKVSRCSELITKEVKDSMLEDN